MYTAVGHVQLSDRTAYLPKKWRKVENTGHGVQVDAPAGRAGTFGSVGMYETSGI